MNLLVFNRINFRTMASSYDPGYVNYLKAYIEHQRKRNEFLEQEVERLTAERAHLQFTLEDFVRINNKHVSNLQREVSALRK